MVGRTLLLGWDVGCRERSQSTRSCTTEIFEVVGQLLSEPSEADYLSPILRAQTLTLLEALELGHKHILSQFLYE
jgi:hypothetical protein